MFLGDTIDRGDIMKFVDKVGRVTWNESLDILDAPQDKIKKAVKECPELKKMSESINAIFKKSGVVNPASHYSSTNIKDYIYVKTENTGQEIAVEYKMSPCPLPTFRFFGMDLFVDDEIYAVVPFSDRTIVVGSLSHAVACRLGEKGKEFASHYSLDSLKYLVESLKMGNFNTQDFVNAEGQVAWAEKYFGDTYTVEPDVYKSAVISILFSEGLREKAPEEESFSYKDLGYAIGSALADFVRYYDNTVLLFSALDSYMYSRNLIHGQTDNGDLDHLKGFVVGGYNVANVHSRSSNVSFAHKFVDYLSGGSGTDEKEIIMQSMVSPVYGGVEIDEIENLIFLSSDLDLYGNIILSTFDMMRYSDPDLALYGEEDIGEVVENIRSLLGNEFSEYVTPEMSGVIMSTITGTPEIDLSDIGMTADALGLSEDEFEEDTFFKGVNDIVSREFTDGNIVIPDEIKLFQAPLRGAKLFGKVAKIICDVMDE